MPNDNLITASAPIFARSNSLHLHKLWVNY